MYGLLRFIVGPYEESEYLEKHEDISPSNLPHRSSGRTNSLVYRLVSSVCSMYYKLTRVVQGFSKHSTCPHPFSCTYYGFVKLFSLGYGLQLCLRVLMQMRRLIRKPSLFPKLLIHRNAIQLGAFLGGFSGIFKLMSCVLRRVFNKDTKYHAIPAGLLAGLAFGFFPDNTVALYVMWKSFQIIYNDSIQKGYVPELPGAIVLLYSFATAVLFHAAVLEPQNLRPSYWKFLHGLSGGRISAMDRKCLDAFGLGTSQSLAETLVKTHTHLVPFTELL
ncbi:hypothetical protein L9F63_013985 [Diploptera punctata]|uniref:Transmembrane protein 135 n=1 Tax=Diploptera punctata TaxID=6984 RepID=A0AAD8A8Z5_DIPPU|nr:hypothetical protein L9F63_013985 [Diploptera punctata]